MHKVPVEYKNVVVEQIGREYEVIANGEMKFYGLPYPCGAITKISIFPDTMTISIDYLADEDVQHDSIGVWVIPRDFEKAVEELLSKVDYKEI